jgi:hypothetical protein
MARYFLHVRGPGYELLDPEGANYTDLEALRASVLMAARELMCADLNNGLLDLRFWIDAEDESGACIYSLPFSAAAKIVLPDIGGDAVGEA